MSLKSLLMPTIAQRMLSRERLLALRAKADKARRARGEGHVLHYFHQVDDPYSTLVAGILPRLLSRYQVALVPHVVGVPPDSAAPERDKLVAYSRRDAALLARHWGLDFADTGRQPGAKAIHQALCLLVAAIQAGRFAQVAGRLSQALWADPAALGRTDWPGGSLAPVPPDDADAHATHADGLRQRMGHYLGATFFYEGEWYWGLDRLYHLEQRLQALGAQRDGATGLMFPPDADLAAPMPAMHGTPIDFFLSLRSPYTAIVAPRVFQLGRLTGAPVRLRYVLPMAMRGLPVPREKRMYISLDTAREAHARQIAFGRLNDPLGKPTERGMALIPLAERMGKGQEYVASFLRGVWSEGIDAGADRGLRRIAERAGLPWDAAQSALQDESWRTVAETNRAEMFSLGLWGVPSFRVGEVSVWGQDRLWAVQEALVGPAEATRKQPA